jgi:hypothetical protein
MRELNQAAGTNSHLQGGMLYLANLCYICNLWPNWEMCLLLFNIGHMIYVLEQFFNANSMVVSILRSD